MRSSIAGLSGGAGCQEGRENSELAPARFAPLLMIVGSLLACALCLAPSARAADACPNAEIRVQQGVSHLPDCLAYEAVSPVLTQGQRAGITLVSQDGNRAILYSLGGFAGIENLPDLGIEYEVNRTEVGWVTKSIAPPASRFPFIGTYGALDFSEDLSRSLWYVNKSVDAGTHNFTPLLRNGNASFDDVAPTQIDDTEGLPSGTSSDLGTVVLASLHRPPLTDGTIDDRRTTRRSMVLSQRQADGSVALKQVAYRAGATMLPNCEPRLGGAPSARGSISADGQTVFFSFPSGLSSCVSPANQRVWVKVGDSEPIDISASQCTTNCGAAAVAQFQGASRDGKRAYFTTDQKLLNTDVDTENKRDLYEYDFSDVGNELRLVTGGGAAAGAGVVNVVRVSEDGTHVYFVATGRMLAGANARGETPQPSDHNLYVYRRQTGAANGSIEFIARLVPADSDLWLGDVRRRVQLTPDGRFMIFASSGDLTDDRLPGDSHEDIFRYEASTGDLRRLWPSAPEHNGANRTGPAILSAQNGASAGGGLQRNWKTKLAITDDGSMVGFSTKEPLSERDMNDQVDAYLWKAETDSITMLTSGDSRVPAVFGMVSPSGDTIFVQSTEPLVSTHVGGSGALFALRRNGGFPVPPSEAKPCRADSCQGSISSTPEPFHIGSTSLGGDGNIQVRDSVRASVGVSKLKVNHGSAARLWVRVPNAGHIRVSGTRVLRTARLVAKAGTYSVNIALRPRLRRALRKRGRLRARVQLRYRAESGGVASRSIRLIFREPKATRTKTKKRGQ